MLIKCDKFEVYLCKPGTKFEVYLDKLEVYLDKFEVYLIKFEVYLDKFEVYFYPSHTIQKLHLSLNAMPDEKLRHTENVYLPPLVPYFAHP
jgi:hypothetical protein